MNAEIKRQRALVAQDREDLGRTVQALAGKVDVPARAKGAAKGALTSAKMRVHRGARRFGRTDTALVLGSTASVMVALASMVVWWRRR
jgi:hypothetical protein